MPKLRPSDFLRRLGNRMRARRLHLGRTRVIVAKECRISVAQLQRYESGEGHPPAFTLHRIAGSLGLSTSTLLAETIRDDQAEIDEMTEIYADPVIGAVIRYMRAMPADYRQSLHAIAAAFHVKSKANQVERVEVMR